MLDIQACPGGTVVKNLPANAGDAGGLCSIPGSGRSPGVGNSNPLQYSCLENSMDRGVWRATVHGVKKNKTWLRNWVRVCAHAHTHTHTHTHTLWISDYSLPDVLWVCLLFFFFCLSFFLGNSYDTQRHLSLSGLALKICYMGKGEASQVAQW